MIDNAAAVQAMIANSTAVSADDIGSSPLPFPGGSSASSASSIAVNANSKNKELAKDFMHWLFSDGPQAKLADALFPSAVGTEVTAPQSKIDANTWIDALANSAHLVLAHRPLQPSSSRPDAGTNEGRD